MSNFERFLLFAVIAGAAIVVLYSRKQPLEYSPSVEGGAPPSEVSEDRPAHSGPRYLMYNKPYGFQPVISGMLPRKTVGQIGEVSPIVIMEH